MQQNLRFTAEQVALQARMRELANTHIRPVAAGIDEKDEYPLEILKLLSEAGVAGPFIPKTYGGNDSGMVMACIANEEIGKVSPGIGVMISVPMDCGFVISTFGTPKQKAKYLPEISKGSKIFNISLTEPGGGSDFGALKTTAVLDGNDYVLNGSKHFVCNVGLADYYTVYASTNPALGSKGITLFLVDKGTPGLKTPKREDKLGIRGHIHGDLELENCRVPKENMIGQPGGGFLIAMKMMDVARLMMAALACGTALEAFDLALDYARKRTAFGKPIVEHEAIAFMLADMAREIHLARLLTYDTAELVDKGTPRLIKESAMSKIYASEVAARVTDRAMQIFGADGYTKELPIERLYRDARSYAIMEGTNEIQRLIVIRELLREIR